MFGKARGETVVKVANQQHPTNKVEGSGGGGGRGVGWNQRNNRVESSVGLGPASTVSGGR